jgi:putative endonuclease
MKLAPPLPTKPQQLLGFFYWMEHVVYIMYSPGSKRNYTGCTSHLIKRFCSHNVFGKDSTAKYRPWLLIHVEFFANKTEALKRENYYKSGRGSIRKNEIINSYLARWAHTLP